MSVYDRIKDDISKRLKTEHDSPIIIGISGSQGSGKSYISYKLKDFYGDECAVLSLDDFYFSQTERKALAQSISPLLETRGPPGTHHIDQMIKLIEQLKNQATRYPIQYPKFDKLADDRCLASNVIHHPPKMVIIEGWCVGANPSDDFTLTPPINVIEQSDADLSWRKHQYEHIKTTYNALWNMVDPFYYLIAPSFDIVAQWKTEQLANDKGVTIDTLSQSDKDWVNNFIQYYERITRGIINGERVEGMAFHLDEDRALKL